MGNDEMTDETIEPSLAEIVDAHHELLVALGLGDTINVSPAEAMMMAASRLSAVEPSPDYVMVPRAELEQAVERLNDYHSPRALALMRSWLSAAPPSPRSEMREALEAARQFIVNGVELGYIHIPKNDPAEHTLGKINAALKEA